MFFMWYATWWIGSREWARMMKPHGLRNCGRRDQHLSSRTMKPLSLLGNIAKLIDRGLGYVKLDDGDMIGTRMSKGFAYIPHDRHSK